jgi:glutamate decarboxylase
LPLHHASADTYDRLTLRPQLARPGEPPTVPKLRLPDGELSADAAYQLVHDELLLDGQARLNLATFVTTWMEPQARVLIDECLDKNMIDKDEYPQTAELERRCVNMLAALWGGEDVGGATGCSTTGSSEACMLGGLALKWRWRERQSAAGRPTDRPNLVMGANVQVCWEKFCRYDVSQTLRVRGWTVPAYRMPPAIDDLAVLRVCVRNGFSRDLASMLLEDLGRAIERVGTHRPGNEGKRASFHH